MSRRSPVTRVERTLLSAAFDFDFLDSKHDLMLFLQWLLPGNVGYEGGAIKFIEGFYSPVSDIIQRLKNAEEGHLQWSVDHAAAIQRFGDFLRKESPGDDPEGQFNGGRNSLT